MTEMFRTNFNEDLLRQIIREEKEKLTQFLTVLRSSSEEDKLLSVKELAGYLGVEDSTVYSWTSKRTVPHFKAGKRVRFRKSEIDAWIEEHRCLTQNELSSRKFKKR